MAPKIRVLFLALACYAGLFFGSSNLPFVGADEPRYARVALEMLLSGDWVIPHLEGHPWLEKPPLYYWSTAVLYSLFGTGEVQARLTSGLALLGLILSVYWYGRRWFSVQAGWIAALMLATCFGAIAFSHAASMDALFSFLLFVGLGAAFDSLFVAGRYAIFEWLFSAAALAGAVLAKGLLGLALPMGLFLVFLVWEGRRGRLRLFWLGLWLGLFLALAVPWHWQAYRRAGFDFLAIYVVNHHLARFFTEIHHHVQPFYYYLPVLVFGLLPWSGLLPLVLRRSVFGHAGAGEDAARPAWRLLLWTALLILGFFSFSASKLPGYILPAFAPLTLLMADGLCLWIGDPLKRESRLKWTALVLGSSLALLGIAAVMLLSYRYGLSALRTFPVGLMLWLGAASLLFVAIRRKVSVESVVVTTAGALTLMMVVLSLLCLSRIGWYHSTRDIALLAQAKAKPGDALASYRFFHHSLAYYSNYTSKGNLENVQKVEEQLLSLGGGSLYLVTEARWFLELRSSFAHPVYRIELLDSRGPLLLARLTPAEPLK